MNRIRATRRGLLLAVVASLAACASAPEPDATPPIVFVHGNGDTAALWLTTAWRFESNGRPRGYFGGPRDQILLDDRSPPAGIPSGIASVAAAKARLPDATPRSVIGEFNGERIVGRSWPTADNRVVLLELHD